ncbi:TetR family transcriptional regulator [Streptomyces sp. NPDC049954]|uniref:TetR family transcriptional regulator n=1 Tax=Streptomyces sp. NPDC049954 TaxID=3155779 RepID=UPI00342AB2D9
MAPGTALDAATILTATEEVLRRYGARRATVVDVARALGVSHAAVYRHFPSKAALREAVTRRWLARSHEDLARLAADAALAPPERLRAWLLALFAVKRARSADDPELFATYRVLVTEQGAAAAEHLALLREQLAGIVAEGIARGDFAPGDPAGTARAVFDATAAFHHPAHCGEWEADGTEAALDGVCTLLLDGLRPR